jgi:hypothetical protein
MATMKIIGWILMLWGVAAGVLLFVADVRGGFDSAFHFAAVAGDAGAVGFLLGARISVWALKGRT